MNHSECTHERTPAGRAACRRAMSHVPEHDAPATQRARQNAADASSRRRASNVTATRIPNVHDVLRGLEHVPRDVRAFLETAIERKLRIQSNPVERGTSFHVLSEVGAITVTWECTPVPKSRIVKEEVAWYARYGFSALSRQITFEEVWNALDNPHPKDYWLDAKG